MSPAQLTASICVSVSYRLPSSCSESKCLQPISLQEEEIEEDPEVILLQEENEEEDQEEDEDEEDAADQLEEEEQEYDLDHDLD